MRGVIYARYSSDNQREESIEGQIRENTAFADKNGIEIVGTYIDRAYSAKTDNRPDFQKMIKDSAGKSFDVVIVWKLDRFARDRYDSAFYKRALRKNGVRVVSATEAISDGPDAPSPHLWHLPPIPAPVQREGSVPGGEGSTPHYPAAG